MSKKKIYVAGPYTKGDVAVNVHTAIAAANVFVELGLVPYIPHLTHFWHLVTPKPYEFWCDYDNQFLPHCDALYRIPGESSGADKEVALARSLGLPVFTDMEAVRAWANAVRDGSAGVA